MKPELKILFYVSARSVKKIRRIAEQLQKYHIAESDYGDPCWAMIDESGTGDLRLFAHLWDVVRGYKTTEFYAGNKLLTRQQAEEVMLWVRCSCNREYFANQSEYCYLLPGARNVHGWGCKWLLSVQRHGDFDKGRGLPWFWVGPFDGSVQYIDKQEIRDKLTAEAKGKCLSLCPLFSLEKVMQYVDKLPDQIDPTKDDKWEYRESVHQEDGIDIAGVKPRQLTVFDIIEDD